MVEKENLIDEKTKNEIIDLSFNFVDSQLFSEIFSGIVKCEFEINYLQKLYRIDLVVEKENEVLIIDYKSDEYISPQALQGYRKQLELYKKAISQIYPQKKILTAILQINDLSLVKILQS